LSWGWDGMEWDGMATRLASHRDTGWQTGFGFGVFRGRLPPFA